LLNSNLACKILCFICWFFKK